MDRFVLLVFAALCAVSTSAGAEPNDRDIVKVNGTSIRQSEVLERLWKRYGAETVEELIDELLLRQAIARAKVSVAPGEIEKRFGKVRAQFSDPKIFETELANAGSSSDKLKADLGEQLLREKLMISVRKISVADDELKKTFTAHKDELGQRESIHLLHLLADKKEEADAIVAQVKSGADFRQLAREKSLAPTGKLNGGDYGFVSKGMLPPEIESVAFAMKDKELRVIPSPKGFHVLQALQRRPAVPAQYAQVKDDLREMMVQEKIKTFLPDYLRELRAKAEIKTLPY